MRIPKPPQKKDEDLKRIIKLYNKLTSRRGRMTNDDEDDDDEDEDGDEDGIDFNIREISDSEHPCYEKDLINREICGERNRPCDNDINGMPRS